MNRTVNININDVVFYYCGWYPKDGVRYPKYTLNKNMALKFLNRSCAINMNKTRDGFVILEDEIVYVIESEIKVE